MNLGELHKRLQELGIAEDRYYLHGLYGSTNDDNKLSVTVKKGAYTTEYEVYYKERGEKYSVRLFTTEDDTCQYVYKRLKDNKEVEGRNAK